MTKDGLAYAIFSIDLCDSLGLETAPDQSVESFASCCKAAYVRLHLHELICSYERERDAISSFSDDFCGLLLSDSSRYKFSHGGCCEALDSVKAKLFQFLRCRRPNAR